MGIDLSLCYFRVYSGMERNLLLNVNIYSLFFLQKPSLTGLFFKLTVLESAGVTNVTI